MTDVEEAEKKKQEDYADEQVLDEENVESLDKDKESSSENTKSNYLFRAITNTMPIIFIGVFASFLTNSFLLGDRYVEKKAINSEITTLIKNGAGLRAVRFHYDHRESVKRDILFSIRNDLSLYYKYDVALSEILEKLRTEQFLNGSPDKDFLIRLDAIITEYTESNPFDKLEAGQKDLFENIRVKLSGNYSVVADDVNKLSDELNNKNKLVNEYLSDSQTSLIVSIVSAFIAVILAGIQMWQNRARHVSVTSRSFRSPVKSEYISENDNGEQVKTTYYANGRIMQKIYSKDGTVRSRRLFPS